MLEFGHFVAGPFAGTLLSDLGADVVKIEPLTGDALRGEDGRTVRIRQPRQASHRALDIKADGGAGIVEAATQWADVVTHNFRPGVDKRLGIDAATLRARKPGIVVVQSTAYGPDGPKAALPGFDTLLQGFAGHFVQAGGDETRPLAYRFSHVDYASGMMGALGVVSALYAGRRGGTAPSVNVSLMNTAVFMLSQLVREADGQFHGLPTLSEDRTGFSPAESLHRAADGWLAVAALGEPAGRRLAEALDLPTAWPSYPRRNGASREKQEIGEAISRRTVQAAVGSLRQSGSLGGAGADRTGACAHVRRGHGGPAKHGVCRSARRTARCSDRSRAGSRRSVGCPTS